MFEGGNFFSAEGALPTPEETEEEEARRRVREAALKRASEAGTAKLEEAAQTVLRGDVLKGVDETAINQDRDAVEALRKARAANRGAQGGGSQMAA